MWGVAAQALAGFAFPAEETRVKLAGLWRAVLTQPVPRHPARLVHRTASTRRPRRPTRSIIARRRQDRLRRDARPGAQGPAALTVFNSLNWQRTALVPLPKGWKAAADASGKRCSARSASARRLTPRSQSLPAAGPASCRRRGHWPLRQPRLRRPASERPARKRIAPRALQRPGRDHEHLRQGSEPRTRRRAVQRFRMYKDVPLQFDAWDLDSHLPVHARRTRCAREGPGAAPRGRWWRN